MTDAYTLQQEALADMERRRAADGRWPRSVPNEPEPEPDHSPGSTWRERDLTAVVDGYLAGTIQRPAPTVGLLDDGDALFYPGRVNGLQGESGAGKSWVVQHVCAQEVSAGRQVVYVDLEDDEIGVAGRMLDLGAQPDQLRPGGGFHYVHPDEAYTAFGADELHSLIGAIAPTLVVIDSTGEAMALEPGEGKDEQVARWFRKMPRPIAERGPAVIVIDHVVKDKASRGLYAAGSHRKRAVITGASYMIEQIKGMARGESGAAKLVVAKDRCGARKPGTVAAVFNLDATGGRPVATLTAEGQVGTDGFMPTHLMEKVSRYLELHPASSKNDVEKAKLGRAEWVRDALRLLVELGHVVVEKEGQAVRHTVADPYREADTST